jgi:hypothetical protein
MLDSRQSSDGVTKPSSKSVPQTIDGLRRRASIPTARSRSRPTPDSAFRADPATSL